MVVHCCQLKLESSAQLHLRYVITLKFQIEIKREIDFFYEIYYFYFAFHLLCWFTQILLRREKYTSFTRITYQKSNGSAKLLFLFVFIFADAVVRMCSVEKVLLEISQNSQENTCARVSFLIKLQAWFPYEFCKIFKNTFFYRPPLLLTLQVPVSTRAQKIYHS